MASTRPGAKDRQGVDRRISMRIGMDKNDASRRAPPCKPIVIQVKATFRRRRIVALGQVQQIDGGTNGRRRTAAERDG